MVWLWCRCGVAGLWTKVGTCGPPYNIVRTLYLVTGAPPSDSGASHATIMNSVDVSTTLTLRGADGLSAVSNQTVSQALLLKITGMTTTDARILRFCTRRILRPKRCLKQNNDKKCSLQLTANCPKYCRPEAFVPRDAMHPLY